MRDVATAKAGETAPPRRGRGRALIQALASAAIAALLVLGVVPPAAAANVTIGNMMFSLDAAQETAVVANYSGGPVATIPATVSSGGVTYAVKEIGFWAFSNKNLTAVTIPEGIETIGSFAFNNNHLTSVTLPSSLRTISTAAFYVNASLETVDLGSGVTSIGDNAFFGTKITSVTFPPSLTHIGVQVFDALASAKFLGPAPATNVNETPLGYVVELVVSYYWRYGASQVPGGFPDPWPNSWGHNMQAIAVVEVEPGTGDAPPAPVEVVVGSTIAEPPQPTRPFHTFAGWFTDPTGGSEWDFGSDVVTGDVELFARWVVDSYTVTLDLGDGSAVLTESVDHGGSVAVPVVPVRAGFTFAGWFTDPTGGSEWEFAADAVTADTALYARWIADSPVTPPPVPGGGAGDPVVPVTPGDPAVPVTPTDPGTVPALPGGPAVPDSTDLPGSTDRPGVPGSPSSPGPSDTPNSVPAANDGALPIGVLVTTGTIASPILLFASAAALAGLILLRRPSASERPASGRHRATS